MPVEKNLHLPGRRADKLGRHLRKNGKHYLSIQT
jgi:hypothetical protein